MRRSILFFALAPLLAACVTVEPPPDPRGTLKPDQRLIVMVHQAPGPWIVVDPDNKAESALKILPLGTFLEGLQEEKINEFSKELQPYLPRPRYDQVVEAELIKALKAAHTAPVQTSAEAGIAPQQRKEWNAAADQLDWRRKYYFTESDRGAPRDYTKLLSLDDAVIVDVNLAFGLEPDAEDRALPTLSAASRAYRADTSRMIWSREEKLGDKASSSTLTEFRAAPADLTDRLYALSAPLAAKIATSIEKAFGMTPPPPPVAVSTAAYAASTPQAPPPAISTATAAIAISSAPPGVAFSSAPPAISVSTH